MLPRLTKTFFPRAMSGIRAFCPKNTHRLFATIPQTHSAEHLQLQHKLFRLKKIPSQVTYLPVGTKFIGLNITQVEPHLLGTAPVFNPGILNAFSDKEKQEWQEMSEKYYAQVGEYELICNLSCVSSKSTNGIPVYFIDHRFLETLSYTPLHKMINAVEDEDQTPALK